MSIVTGRLAPSPTGILHLGNVRTFLWAWLSARSQGGRVVLRIEDLEKPALPGIVEALLSDLVWLGFDWDEGPVWGEREEKCLVAGQSRELIETGPHGPYLQRARGAFYRRLFEDLRNRGLIYPCRCRRSDYAGLHSAPHEGEGEARYPGTCRHRDDVLAGGEGPGKASNAGFDTPEVWRFRVPEGSVVFQDRLTGPQAVDVQASIGDFVVFRSPQLPTYQLAVVADDAAMGVTEVVRGDDLIPSTARQLLLYKALGLTAPSYLHVPLVTGPDGKRLAKRHGDGRVRSLRDRGVRPETIIGALARWSGLKVDGAVGIRDLIEPWNVDTLSRERLVMDRAKWQTLDKTFCYDPN